MALYKYVKSDPRKKRKEADLTKVVPFFSVSSLMAGLVLIFSATYPIISYQLKSVNFRKKIIAPLVGFDTRNITSSGIVLGREDADPYEKASNWYPSAPVNSIEESRITHYNISIPSLGIARAIVQVGGEDLMSGLVQYPGTSLPGQFGNTVIFGHSVLPQFFNPKNYKTIFSTLPTVKKGETIFVDFDGIAYKYIVISIDETTPDDLTVLQQHYDAEYMSLITCVPPGTYSRRLIIKARLAKS